ncbi:hypothetical protein Emed_007284 [Eimeria media]
MRAPILAYIFLLLSAERAWAASPAGSQVFEATEEVKEEPELPAEEASVSIESHSSAEPELPTTATSSSMNSSDPFGRQNVLDIILIVGLALILWKAERSRGRGKAIGKEARKKGGEGEDTLLPSVPSAPEGQTQTLPSDHAEETPGPTPPSDLLKETLAPTPPSDLDDETPGPTPPPNVEEETPLSPTESDDKMPPPPNVEEETPLSPTESDDKMPAPPEAIPGSPSSDKTEKRRRHRLAISRSMAQRHSIETPVKGEGLASSEDGDDEDLASSDDEEEEDLVSSEDEDEEESVEAKVVETDSGASPLKSTSRSESGSSQSLGILENTSDDGSFIFSFVPEQPRPRQPAKGTPYGFLLIDGEDNRRNLQELMQTIYKWRMPHFGLSKSSCTVQLGNVLLQVEAKELGLGFGVRLEDSRPTGIELSLWIQSNGINTVSNGFFVEEAIPSELKGRFHIIVDASFAESSTSLKDISQDGDDDETQGAAGPSGSAGMQQSSPQTSPQQLQLPATAAEGSPLGSAQLVHPEDVGEKLYAFPQIPGPELLLEFMTGVPVHRVEGDWGGPGMSVAVAGGEGAAAGAAPPDPQRP